MTNLCVLTEYMITNHIFKTKEEAMGKIGVLFMIGQISQENLLELSQKVSKAYPDPVKVTEAPVEEAPVEEEKEAEAPVA